MQRRYASAAVLRRLTSTASPTGEGEAALDHISGQEICDPSPKLRRDGDGSCVNANARTRASGKVHVSLRC